MSPCMQNKAYNLAEEHLHNSNQSAQHLYMVYMYTQGALFTVPDEQPSNRSAHGYVHTADAVSRQAYACVLNVCSLLRLLFW